MWKKNEMQKKKYKTRKKQMPDQSFHIFKPKCCSKES